MPQRTEPLDYAARQRLQRVTLQKQAAPPPPPPTATARFLDAIQAHQAQAGCTFAEASTAVCKQAPELYTGYTWESRHPGQAYSPVAKQAAPAYTYATVLALVDERRADQLGKTRDEAWVEVLRDAEGRKEVFAPVHKAYTTYMRTDAIVDRDAARLAAIPTGKE